MRDEFKLDRQILLRGHIHRGHNHRYPSSIDTRFTTSGQSLNSRQLRLSRYILHLWSQDHLHGLHLCPSLSYALLDGATEVEVATTYHRMVSGVLGRVNN